MLFQDVSLMQKKICVIATVEIPIRAFLVPHLRSLQHNYDITVVLNTQDPGFLKPYGISATVVPFALHRKIAPFQDLCAFFNLILFFRRNHFELVHSITPKAGLLAMLAGFIAATPRRLHWFTGQVWATSRGFKRALLKSMDRLTASFATHLLADSPSQKDVLINEGIVTPSKIMVLGKGSVCGVDTIKFKQDREIRRMIRQQLDIPSDAMLFLYLGRLTIDKGLLDLACAFLQLISSGAKAFLLVVGPDEEDIKSQMEQIFSEKCNYFVRFKGYAEAPEQYMAAADVLCLPSYREGFGMVTLEAAAVGIPSIASRIYGITDAVVEGFTGLLHNPGDVGALSSCMSKLLYDKKLRFKLGLQAQQRAEQDFFQAQLVSALQKYYLKLFERA